MGGKELPLELDGEAKIIRPLRYYIKYAAMHFTHEGKYHRIDPAVLDTSGEVFDCLGKELTDRMYEPGVCKMFYSGMLD